MEAVQAPFPMAAAGRRRDRRRAGGLNASSRRDATARRERLRKSRRRARRAGGFLTRARGSCGTRRRSASGSPSERPRRFPRRLRLSRARAWFCARGRSRAGLEQAVSPEGFCEASMRLACAGGLAGALVGSVLSTELAVLGAVAGVAGGAAAMPRAVKRAQRERADGLESDLSGDALEVVALGLRSGLSFDRGFCAVRVSLRFGLGACVRRRPACLVAGVRRIAKTRCATRSASVRPRPLFARVVENMVRPLRFGSSLAEGLESAAAEALRGASGAGGGAGGEGSGEDDGAHGHAHPAGHAAARAGAVLLELDGRNVGMRRFAHGDVFGDGWRRRRAGFESACSRGWTGHDGVPPSSSEVLVVIAIIAITVFRPKLQELWTASPTGSTRCRGEGRRG